jgi:hypothetical protein
MKLKYFEWSSKMSKTIKSLAVVALLATPTFASADAIAASISASFGANGLVAVDTDDALTSVTNPTSVSVAGAVGLVAVATASATAAASSATSAASDDELLAPTLTVNFTSSGYESTVAFTPVIDAAAVAAAVCAGVSATQAGSTGELAEAAITGVADLGFFGEADVTGSVTNDVVTITDGDITVSCAVPS